MIDPHEHALREIHTAWIAAVNAGDLDTLLDLMAEDALFLTPGQAPVDRAAFSAGFRAAHQASRVRCVSELRELTVAGEIAWTLSEDALTVAPRSGGPVVELWGHRMSLYRKHPDGRWRLMRDAHTLVPEQPEA